jgi:glycosyltransferase involved in cell wall biosynthesis
VGAVSLLRQGFLEAGHEVYLLAPGFEDYQDIEAGIFRYPAVNLTSKVKFPIAIPFSPRMKRKLKGLQFDIIHTHHPFVLGPVALQLARRRNIPIIYTFHTQYDQYTHYVPLPSNLVRWFSTRQVRRFSQAVNQITTPAQSACRVLLDYGVTNSIRVIPNPIDLDKFLHCDGMTIRKKYQLGQEKLLINIGRVAPEKNLNLLLNSFKLMLAKAPQNSLKLMIVGDGPELTSLVQQANTLGIQDTVIFTGLVNPTLVPEYLAAADLFVMTSTTEVKPLAQLEAFASGLPIVAVAAAGANDTITHDKNGLLVPENSEAFADAVLSLVFDPERYQYFKKDAYKTATQYAYSTIAAEYLGLFERLIRDQKKFSVIKGAY